MVRIIKAETGETLGLTESVLYIRRGENGCFVPASEREAEGVAFRSVPYRLFGRTLEGVEETVLLSSEDGGGTLARHSQALMDVDAMAVDQEYRLTLLELGITEDA